MFYAGLLDRTGISEAFDQEAGLQLRSSPRFLMLPIALTLPDVWQAAVVVIVFQSLVAQFGMEAYLSEMPSKLIPKPSPT